MATAKQKAWRTKFAALYGRKKGRKTRRSKRAGDFVARRSFRKGKRGGFGGSLLKGVLFAVGGAKIAEMLNMPSIAGAVVGGYLGGNVKGAAIGAGMDYLGIPKMIPINLPKLNAGALGSGSGINWLGG